MLCFLPLNLSKKFNQNLYIYIDLKYSNPAFPNKCSARIHIKKYKVIQSEMGIRAFPIEIKTTHFKRPASDS